jgi:hypothetical protein
VHGGAKGSGRPPKHGRSAKTFSTSEKVREKYEANAKRKDPYDLTHVVNLMLAYFDIAREKIDKKLTGEAELSAEDSSELMAWSETLSKLCERANKLKYNLAQLVTYEDAYFIVNIEIPQRNLVSLDACIQAGLIPAKNRERIVEVFADRYSVPFGKLPLVSEQPALDVEYEEVEE